MSDKFRTEKHEKIHELERVFPEMEELLGEVESKVLEKFEQPKLPIFFLVGCARSGSTVLYQVLANTGWFTYPTNIISRFYYAPYIGARIQQLLVDFDLRGEIFNNSSRNKLNSDLGKTFGPKEPHEFWYFWNRFFKFLNTQRMSAQDFENVDWIRFKKELAAFESVYDKPILMKAMNMNWHIVELSKELTNAHFIFVKRDVLYNGQSLLLARQRFFADMSMWYSFKPPEYNTLSRLSPEEQVIRQVELNNQVVIDSLLKLPENRYSVVQYEDFVKDPREFISSLTYEFPVLSEQPFAAESLAFRLENENVQKLESTQFSMLKKYINDPQRV